MVLGLPANQTGLSAGSAVTIIHCKESTTTLGLSCYYSFGTTVGVCAITAVGRRTMRWHGLLLGSSSQSCWGETGATREKSLGGRGPGGVVGLGCAPAATRRLHILHVPAHTLVLLQKIYIWNHGDKMHSHSPALHLLCQFRLHLKSHFLMWKCQHNASCNASCCHLPDRMKAAACVQALPRDREADTLLVVTPLHSVASLLLAYPYT